MKSTNIDFGRQCYRTLFNNDELLVVLTQIPAGAPAPADIARSKGLLIVTEGSATYSDGVRRREIGPGEVLDLPLRGRLEARTLLDYLYFSECERNAYNQLNALWYAAAS